MTEVDIIALADEYARPGKSADTVGAPQAPAGPRTWPGMADEFAAAAAMRQAAIDSLEKDGAALTAAYRTEADRIDLSLWLHRQELAVTQELQEFAQARAAAGNDRPVAVWLTDHLFTGSTYEALHKLHGSLTKVNAEAGADVAQAQRTVDAGLRDKAWAEYARTSAMINDVAMLMRALRQRPRRAELDTSYPADAPWPDPSASQADQADTAG